MVLAILSSLWGGCVTVGTLTVQRKENTLMAKRDGGQVSGIAPDDSGHNVASSELLRELVAHLRQNRTQLREEWVGRISETRLLTAMTKEEIFAEATSVYDSYVEALETETFEALQAYARNLSELTLPRRGRQLTEQLVRGIRTNRAKVVVIDITGVAAMDVTVANHLVQTVEASRLLGATVIVTGLSPEIAQTLVTIGVDLGKMNTV